MSSTHHIEMLSCMAMLLKIFYFQHFVGATTVLWNITETGTNEWITYLLSYNEAQEHDVRVH